MAIAARRRRGVRFAAAVNGVGRASPRRLSAVFSLFASACVFVPKTTSEYDADCRMVSRQMTLEPVQVASVHHCTNDCGAVLAFLGATAVASAVVSGSIVIVGNVVFWLEKQGQCRRPAAPGDEVRSPAM